MQSCPLPVAILADQPAALFCKNPGDIGALLALNEAGKHQHAARLHHPHQIIGQLEQYIVDDIGNHDPIGGAQLCKRRTGD